MTRQLSKLAIALLLLAPAVAFAQARVLQFRSAEDPNSPADPAVCALAPFAANLRIGGTLYAYPTRRDDGQVEVNRSHPIGRATACAQITSLAFPAGLQQKFFVGLQLPDGNYTAAGTCTIVSNDVPRRGLVLAGCSLKLTSFPAGVTGGAVVSLSTFNPLRLQGFATGSYWTVQIYDAAGEQGPESDSDKAMDWAEGDDHDDAG